MSSLITFRKDYPALSSWALCNQCSEYFNVEKEGRKISVAVMYFGKGYINSLSLDFLFLGSLTLTLFPHPGSLSLHIMSRWPGRGQNGSDALISIYIKEAWVQYSSAKLAQGILHFQGTDGVPADLKDLQDVHWLHVGQDTICTCVDVVSGVF